MQMRKNGIEEYSSQTGKPIYSMECSSGKCGHDGVKHKWSSLPWYRLADFICLKCGKKESKGACY